MFFPDESPSAESLHFHRCYSSTAPTIKTKFKKELQSNLSRIRIAKLRPSEALKCNMCTKVFSHVNSLRQHMKVHTEGASCSVCGKVLCRRYQLKVHLKKQHGIDLIPKKE